MPHFLITATKQEIFDAAYMGLKSQGFEKCMDKTGDECVYDDKQGHHCAIGWACALSKSKMPKEGYSIISDGVWESTETNKIQVPKNRACFLSDLQYIHDNAESFESMRLGLEEFASKHNLTVPSFDVPRKNEYELKIVGLTLPSLMEMI